MRSKTIRVLLISATAIALAGASVSAADVNIDKPGFYKQEQSPDQTDQRESSAIFAPSSHTIYTIAREETAAVYTDTEQIVHVVPEDPKMISCLGMFRKSNHFVMYRITKDSSGLNQMHCQ